MTTLQLLLDDPERDVLYVFHDPAQALYRPDVSGGLGLHEYPLDLNCRNPGRIHAFAYRWYTGDLHSEPMREEGRAPVIIEAAAGEATVEAVGAVLRDIVHGEKVPKEQVVVLLGGSLRNSAIWQHRRFKGGLELWNGNVTRTGESLGLAFDRVPAQPRGMILCDSIRRFKGLDREVVILAELDPDDDRLGQLLYVGASRAREHLVVIVPPELVGWLHETGRSTQVGAVGATPPGAGGCGPTGRHSPSSSRRALVRSRVGRCAIRRCGGRGQQSILGLVHPAGPLKKVRSMVAASRQR